MTTTLYTIDSKDRTRVWKCWQGEQEGVHGIFYQDGLLEGKIKDPIFKEAKEKNVGKANYMSAERQAAAMVEQEAGKKLRKNYFHTIEEAQTNKLWLPMLAHKFEKYEKKLVYPVFSQAKLDGARCNIYWDENEGRIVARTRTGKLYSAVVDHIIAELSEVITSNKEYIFDGELYNHDLKHDFEKLMSLSRQSKPTAEDIENAVRDLQFHVYDIYNRDAPDSHFADRLQGLKLLGQQDFHSIRVVETETANSREELDEMEGRYIEEGYEGQMVRVPLSVYKVDGRSQELLKKKQFTDAEFPIVEVHEGKGTWKGIAKQLVIELPDGRTQGCGIDGSFEVNRERWENRESLIGKLATVRFFRYTSDGLLYIPVCKDIDRHDI